VRKIAAHYLFPLNRAPIKHGILTCTNEGTIIEISESNGNLTEQSGLEFYTGILVPGFVNAKLRDSKTRFVVKTVQLTDRKMWAAGIAAVGDISDPMSTVGTKINRDEFHGDFSELVSRQMKSPHLTLDELFSWACLNGAKALQIDNNFGSFEIGKKPGINLISGIDFKKMRLTDKSKMKRLV
jgi:cytosine/adenosine deaminase-related metal-dependent hydrolase